MWVLLPCASVNQKKVNMAGHTMSVFILPVLTIVFLMSDVSIVHCKDCNVSNINVEPNFHLKRYASGSWYEMKWLAAAYHPPEELFQDYRHDYSIDISGNVSFVSSGRNPKNLSVCFDSSGYLLKTNEPAKLILTKKSIRYPYWILKTDYTSYALVYGCFNVSRDGGCYGAKSWIWSRETTISRDKMEIVENVIKERLCVDLSLYLTTEQHDECPHHTISGANFEDFSRRSILTFLIMFLVYVSS